MTLPTACFAANGSLGALLLHHHNGTGQRAEVVPLDTAQRVDLTITNVALPTIGRKLHFPEQDLQWVVTAYALTFGASFAAAYAASKGGIVQMTRALATAWAKDNIQVNAVLPGWIDTDLTRRARQQVAE